MQGLRKMLSVRLTYVGIAATILFQLIFFTVWMTAYDQLDNRYDQLQIAIVNQDSDLDQQLQESLIEHLPFQTEQVHHLEDAEQLLNERYFDMVIAIPQNFTSDITKGKQTNLDYMINQATATLTKSIMETTAFQLTNRLNSELFSMQQHVTIEMLSKQLEQLPTDESIKQLLQKEITQVVQYLQDEAVFSSVHKVNHTEGFAATLVPLMIIISSFVGAMVMIMQHENAAQIIRNDVSKWQLFIGSQLINMGVGLLLPLITITLMYSFSISSHISALQLYVFQAVLFWTFLLVAQLFVVAFGSGGMVFNIVLLSLQLVTSGVLVPRKVLSPFYESIAKFLPATYGADGYYTIVFGGADGNIKANLLALLIIAGVSLILSVGLVAIRKNKVK